MGVFRIESVSEREPHWSCFVYTKRHEVQAIESSVFCFKLQRWLNTCWHEQTQKYTNTTVVAWLRNIPMGSCIWTWPFAQLQLVMLCLEIMKSGGGGTVLKDICHRISFAYWWPFPTSCCLSLFSVSWWDVNSLLPVPLTWLLYDYRLHSGGLLN